MASKMVAVLSEEQLRNVLNKLDAVKVELLRLRAMLLSEEDITDEEKRQIETARKEISAGESISFKALRKELGE